MTYYAVITEPHKEIAVRHILKKAGETTFIPAFVQRQKAGKGKRRLIPIIPRLVFVRAPEAPEAHSLWMWRVKQVRGVKSFFMLGGVPAYATDDDLTVFKGGIYDDVKANRIRPPKVLRKGKDARIKSGPFAGEVGQVTFVNNNRVKMRLEKLFRTEREIEIRADNLEAA